MVLPHKSLRPGARKRSRVGEERCGPVPAQTQKQRALEAFVINVGDLGGVGRSAGEPMLMRRLEPDMFDITDRRPDGGDRFFTVKFEVWLTRHGP